jgi:hypothetical protein
VEAAEQTAATVSAARRAEDVCGNGIPPGTYLGAGTRVVRGTTGAATCGAVATRVENALGTCHVQPTSTRVNLLCAPVSCQGSGHVLRPTGR